MPDRYRVFVTEEGRTTRAVSIDYIANSVEEAEQMYYDGEPFDDFCVDDDMFDVDDSWIDHVEKV